MNEMEESSRVDDSDDHSIDGDNFLLAVLKSNSDMMRRMSQQEVLGKNPVSDSEDSSGGGSSAWRGSEEAADDEVEQLDAPKDNRRPEGHRDGGVRREDGEQNVSKNRKRPSVNLVAASRQKVPAVKKSKKRRLI